MNPLLPSTKTETAPINNCVFEKVPKKGYRFTNFWSRKKSIKSLTSNRQESSTRNFELRLKGNKKLNKRRNFEYALQRSRSNRLFALGALFRNAVTVFFLPAYLILEFLINNFTASLKLVIFLAVNVPNARSVVNSHVFNICEPYKCKAR